MCLSRGVAAEDLLVPDTTQPKLHTERAHQGDGANLFAVLSSLQDLKKILGINDF